MAEYLVTWAIDIEADNPREAAMKAFEKIRATSLEDEEGCAVFTVVSSNLQDEAVVDLCNPE